MKGGGRVGTAFRVAARTPKRADGVSVEVSPDRGVVYGLCPLFVSGAGVFHPVPCHPVAAEHPPHAGDLGPAEPAQRCAYFADSLGEYHRPRRRGRCAAELSQHLPAARRIVPGRRRTVDHLRPGLQGRHRRERHGSGGVRPGESGRHHHPGRCAPYFPAPDGGGAGGTGRKAPGGASGHHLALFFVADAVSGADLLAAHRRRGRGGLHPGAAVLPGADGSHVAVFCGAAVYPLRGL